MTLVLYRPDRTYLVSPGDRLETDLGIIEVPDSVDPDTIIESHTGEQFTVLRPRNTDLFDHLDRSGAPMLPRDIGLIVGMGGLQSGDRILDVGTGTGILAITLARLGMVVTTFERNPDAASLARRNIERAGVTDRVEVHEGDATTASIEERFDALTLDTGDVDTIVASSPDRLVPGGVVAAYSPFIEQARAAASAAEAADLAEVQTLETIQRPMAFDSRGSRPSTGPVGHSGYLTFARKLPGEAER